MYEQSSVADARERSLHDFGQEETKQLFSNTTRILNRRGKEPKGGKEVELNECFLYQNLHM